MAKKDKIASDKEFEEGKAAEESVEAEAAERAAKTPEQRLHDDWPAKHTVLAPFITELGKVRGGLNVPDRAEAKEILKRYGFKV